MLNYEDLTNSDHEYKVIVKATDPSNLTPTTASSTVKVTIKVTNVDEDPSIAGGDQTNTPTRRICHSSCSKRQQHVHSDRRRR